VDVVTTVCGIALGAGIFLLCWLRERRPRVMGEVRIFPYVPVMMVCLVMILVLLAHLVSLGTGKPVDPRGVNF
jgi:hypothetical protein